jgi:chitodextrinase
MMRCGQRFGLLLGVFVAAALSAMLAESTSLTVCDPGGEYVEWTGCPIQFDGSGSYAPGGFIVSYAWDFGDGTTGQGVRPTHTYWVDSRNLVVLTVTDNLGGGSACSTYASVYSDNIFPPLECEAGGPYVSSVGDSVHFVGTANMEKLPMYHWDFGDGTTGSGSFPTHAYSSQGQYEVTLNVTDAMPLACHFFERAGACKTTAFIGVNPVKPATWGFLKGLYRE